MLALLASLLQSCLKDELPTDRSYKPLIVAKNWIQAMSLCAVRNNIDNDYELMEGLVLK